MKVSLPSAAGAGEVHLTYCLNIHPGENWAENLAAISNHAIRVRDTVTRGRSFGLGLRLSNEAAMQLAEPDTLCKFRDFLARENMYVFTINGFPYGRFHGAAVKADVYKPDWRSPERRDYTMLLIDILAALLPAGVSGSISTVPGAYGQWIYADDDVRRMGQRLAEAACHAERVRRQTGKDICIALEPECDCFIETTAEAVEFISRTLPQVAATITGAETLTRHVGVCLDTAHMAVQFEDICESLRLTRASGVRVGKIQLSSALRLAPTAEALDRLKDFVDPVYLHQVRVRFDDESVWSFPDLSEAIETLSSRKYRCRCAELRVHFHVPLFFTQAGPLASTSSLLGPEFWREAAQVTEYLEIETYTFGVLPDDLRTADAVESIRREYEWVMSPDRGD